MTQLFEIKEVEGKGLGWVATKNIKRGTVIFTEKPQLALNCCSEKQMESGNRVKSSTNYYMLFFDENEKYIPRPPKCLVLACFQDCRGKLNFSHEDQ